jgi:hypothetical protein
MATNPAGAAETTVAGDAAAALPPQLNEMLGDAAPKVASFAELVRGVSWTQQHGRRFTPAAQFRGLPRRSRRPRICVNPRVAHSLHEEAKEAGAARATCRSELLQARPRPSATQLHRRASVGDRFQNLPGHSAGRQGCN